MKFTRLCCTLALSVAVAHAFAPRALQESAPYGGSALFVTTDPTNTNTDLSSLSLHHPAISPFGKGQDSNAAVSADKSLLGGKGANLAVMTSIGLSVPPGFTISTECCDRFCNAWNQELPQDLWNQIKASLKDVEEEMQAEFGSATNPLLLSVRSGAATSMPGRYSTVRTVPDTPTVLYSHAPMNHVPFPFFLYYSHRYDGHRLEFGYE